MKVTAESLDPRTTTVAQIMTRNPMVTRDTTSATEALQLMVSRHFRHLVSRQHHQPISKLNTSLSAMRMAMSLVCLTLPRCSTRL